MVGISGRGTCSNFFFFAILGRGRRLAGPGPA